MNQELPNEGQFQNFITLRSIGSYLVHSLIRSGDCTVMRLSPINNQNLPPITEFEVENFAWRVNSKDFDLAFDQLTKAYK